MEPREARVVLILRCGLGALALPVTLAALAVPLGERWSGVRATASPRC